MSGDTIAVAGATGSLGREIVRELRARGYGVRPLARSEVALAALDLPTEGGRVIDALNPESLRGVFAGVSAVISTVGASVAPKWSRGRAGYLAIDWPANKNLVDEAERAGCAKYVYVAAVGGDRHRDLGYFDAHERVVVELKSRQLPFAVIRATGFFSAFEEFLVLARRGIAPVIGDGSARTNPIAESDLAAICVDALAPGAAELAVGGPQILSRREIAALAFKALGKRPRLIRVPPLAFTGLATLLRPLHPRLADLFQFVTRVSTRDVIGDARGRVTLAEHFSRCLTRR
ncbi:MAG: NAD(P)H-binding protein [Planctomycetota bacterium]